jgi:hypothetical protein
MSLNTINKRSTSPSWTWRVTTPGGTILIANATIGEAVRKAGMAGPEAVQPATAEEHQNALACPVAS